MSNHYVTDSIVHGVGYSDMHFCLQVMMNAIECVVCNRRDTISTVWPTAPDMFQHLGFSCASSPYQMANRVAYNHLFNEAFVSQHSRTQPSSEEEQHVFQCLKATAILIQV